MSVNAHDVTLMLREIGDLIRTEADRMNRLALLDSFVQETTDIARDSYLATVYQWRCEGVSSDEVATMTGHHVASVNRWVTEYAERHSLPKPPRHGAPRLDGARRLPPTYRRTTLPRRSDGTIPGA